MLFLLLVCPKFPLLSHPPPSLSLCSIYSAANYATTLCLFFRLVVNLHPPESGKLIRPVSKCHHGVLSHRPTFRWHTRDQTKNWNIRQRGIQSTTDTQKQRRALLLVLQTGKRKIIPQTTGHSLVSGVVFRYARDCSRGNLRKKKIRATKKQLPAGFPLIKMNSILSWTLMEK